MKKYGKDYRKNQQGYEYTGEWHKSSMTVEELRAGAVQGFLYLAPMTLLFLAGLSFDNEGGRTFLVLLPYVGMCFPLAYGWMGCGSLWGFCKKQRAGGDRTDGSGRADSSVLVPKEHEGEMVRSEYERSVLRPCRCAWALDILSAAALASEGWLVIRAGRAAQGREYLLLCVITAILCLSAALTRHCSAIKKNFSAESTKNDSEGEEI